MLDLGILCEKQTISVRVDLHSWAET